MLGLQTRHDIQNVARLTSVTSTGGGGGTSNHRSHKFAKHLSSAGFATIGQTNSMKKHTESKTSVKEKLTSQRKQNLN